jgi:molybdopterin synthase catalytic subunit
MHVSETATPSSICVHVRLFASYREAAGTNRLDTSVPNGASVGDLLASLEGRLPVLRQARGLVAVNHSYVQPETVLQDGDEVALIPPVSGGS